MFFESDLGSMPWQAEVSKPQEEIGGMFKVTRFRGAGHMMIWGLYGFVKWLGENLRCLFWDDHPLMVVFPLVVLRFTGIAWFWHIPKWSTSWLLVRLRWGVLHVCFYKLFSGRQLIFSSGFVQQQSRVFEGHWFCASRRLISHEQQHCLRCMRSHSWT